jgi:multidrug efflux pump subunit AcrA (membrane-fusion protein)
VRPALGRGEVGRFRVRTHGRAGGLLLLLLSTAAACDRDASEAAPAPDRGTPVAVWVVEGTELSEERGWTGSLAPLRVHPMYAPTEARVAQVSVRDGDRVGAGTLLLRLAGVAEDARREVLAEREGRLAEELARWRELATEGAAGPGEVVAAELRLFEAREALASLDALREAMELRAGVAGRVVGLASAPGMLTAPGQLLLTLEEDGSYGVRLRVPAGEARWFDDPSHLVIEGSGGDHWAVGRVALGPDAMPGYVQVDLYPEAGPPTNRQGATVRFQAPVSVQVVPWTAVATEGDASWVAVAAPDDEAPDDVPAASRFRVERRAVVLGGAREDGIEVLEGLRDGDRVLRYEPRSHPEGRRVEPRVAAERE